MPPTIIDLIEFRAFASVWYWALIGLVWTRVIHAPAGVPADLIRRADKGDVQAREDVDALASVMLRERAAVSRSLGAWAAAIWAFGLTVLLLLSVVYWIEAAQALSLIAVPLALVSALASRTRRRILAEAATGARLRRHLRRLRAVVQGIGLVSVFLTALWGMIWLLAARAL